MYNLYALHLSLLSKLEMDFITNCWFGRLIFPTVQKVRGILLVSARWRSARNVLLVCPRKRNKSFIRMLKITKLPIIPIQIIYIGSTSAFARAQSACFCRQHPQLMTKGKSRYFLTISEFFLALCFVTHSTIHSVLVAKGRSTQVYIWHYAFHSA